MGSITPSSPCSQMTVPILCFSPRMRWWERWVMRTEGCSLPFCLSVSLSSLKFCHIHSQTCLFYECRKSVHLALHVAQSTTCSLAPSFSSGTFLRLMYPVDSAAPSASPVFFVEENSARSKLKPYSNTKPSSWPWFWPFIPVSNCYQQN